MTDWKDGPVSVLVGDCRERLRELPTASMDALVTDPPAGIGFMGSRWDSFRTDMPDSSFLNWFAGFVDGEGCFSIHRKPQGTFDCQFSISLRSDDRPVLEMVRRTLGMGTISSRDAHATGTDNPKVRYSISAKRDCARLVAIFRAAPLRAKKARDFELWAEGVLAWLNHRQGEWDDLADVRDRLMAVRRWTEFAQTAGRPERRAFIAEMRLVFRECLRVLKPGAHGLVWAIPRTSHWTATALEDAGFEVRDVITHHFGSGFPKSLDVSKAIDKAAGAEREVVGKGINYDAKVKHGGTWTGGVYAQDAYTGADGPLATAPATDAARQWQGWGTALKPATEHWILVRRPLDRPNVAANVLAHGTGALNIDGCRIGSETIASGGCRPGKNSFASAQRDSTGSHKWSGERVQEARSGRWPANLVLSHAEGCVPVGTRRVRGAGWRDSDESARDRAVALNSARDGSFRETRGHHYADRDGLETVEQWSCVECCPVAELDRQSGTLRSGFMAAGTEREGLGYRGGLGCEVRHDTIGDSGGASRFFYVAKASPRERSAGLPNGQRNVHPTVKPIALMRWLCRLVTPPAGVVLDPFMGSGTTGIAAVLEGLSFVGIEQDEESVRTAIARLRHWRHEPELLEAR